MTETPQRAYIEDAKAHTLTKKTKVLIFGVLPGQLAQPTQTLGKLAKITHLDLDRVLGRVRSAPPQEFLPLVTLQLPAQAGDAAQLLQVPGVQARTKYLPIAPAAARATSSASSARPPPSGSSRSALRTSRATRSASPASRCSSSAAWPAPPP